MRGSIALRPVRASLHGLVRHMAEVERSWFRRVLQREPDAPYIWYDPKVEDSDTIPLDEADWVDDLALWQAECEESRKAAASRSPEDTGMTRSGKILLAEVDLRPQDRGVCPAQRPRGPDP